MSAPVILIVLLVLMACRPRSTGATIPSDFSVPLPPPQGGNAARDENGYALTPTTLPEVPRVLNSTPQEVTYVDPWIPVPAPQGGSFTPDHPDTQAVLVADPWAVPPTELPANYDQPVKTNPVAPIEPPTEDPQNPVPTRFERDANSVDPSNASDLADVVLTAPVTDVPQAVDYWNPVPSPASDPALFSTPPAVDVPPAPPIMDNWTATSTEETACPDDESVAVELSF
jgi:hypothetical protein